MFALGYSAGYLTSRHRCWFRLEQIHHLTCAKGSILASCKPGQLRTIVHQIDGRRARLSGERKQIQTDCPFAFLSQRRQNIPRRLTEIGVYVWWRIVKEKPPIAGISLLTLPSTIYDTTRSHRLRTSSFTHWKVTVSQGHTRERQRF